MKKIIRVEGMHCSHCKDAVEKAVRALAGVTRADVNLEAKTLTVECAAAAVTDAALRDAVEDEGYRVF